MTAIFSLLPLVFAFILIGALTKLAAKLYRRSLLSWKHALAFSALAMAAGGIGALLNYVSGHLLGPMLAIALGLAIQLALGGWFLGSRASSPQGEPVAFKGGSIIAAIGFGLVIAIGVVAAVLVPLLGGTGQA